MIAGIVTPRKLYNFYIDPDLAEGLKTLKERRRTSEGQLVREAIQEYLSRNGVTARADRKRAGRRKRP
jgi:hypothetical protein